MSTDSADLIVGGVPVSVVRKAIKNLHLSARVVDRTLKVAQTVTDLAGGETVSVEAVAEALRYRPPAGLLQPAGGAEKALSAVSS